MKTLFNSLKRVTLGTENPGAGRIDGATGSRRAVRKSPRARLGLEYLETRDLMSGLTLPASGGSTAPPIRSGGTPTQEPAAQLAATAMSPTAINLVWSDQIASNLVPTTEVYESYAGNVPTLYATIQGDPKAYPVTGLSPNTQYQFQVTINGATGSSPGSPVSETTTSNFASATTFLPLVGTPTLTVTAASSTSVSLTWSGVSNAQSFDVDWWPNSGTPIQLSGSATGDTVTGLNPYTSYTFQVWAYDGVGTSASSNVPSATTLPASPTLTATPASSFQINLTWTSVTGASDYIIDNVAMGNPTLVADAHTSTSYPLSGLSAYTGYDLEVGAVGPWGISWSNQQPVTTLPTPLVLTATPMSKSLINLNWNSISSASSYVVYELNGTTWTEYGSALTGTSCPVTGLTAGDSYTFKVGDLGVWGLNWSNVVTPVTYPAAPTATATTVSTSSVELTWSNVANANGYIVNASVNGIVQQAYTFQNNNTLSYDFQNLSAGTTYVFNVAAFNAAGDSWSQPVTATTLLAAPSLTVQRDGPVQADLSWNSVTGASAYIVEEWTAYSSTWTQISVVTGTSYDISNLPLGSSELAVVAVGLSGSAWSNVVPQTVMFRPVPV